MSDSWPQLFVIFVQILRVLGHAEVPPPLNEQNDDDFESEPGFVDVGGPPFKTCPTSFECLGGYFECKKQNLRQVPGLPPWITHLILPGNKLDDSVANSIGNLTDLIALNLKKNRLTKIPTFKGLISLEKLNLAHNRIQVIAEEALLPLVRLKELDLAKNHIKSIQPNAFPSRNQLSILNLVGNHISSLRENDFTALKSLLELHLGHNRLNNLPHDVFKSLVVLRKLDLSNNDLNITWPIFRGLDQLRVLKIRSNGIEFLPDGVFEALKSIVSIELDSNRITSLSRSGFFNVVTLTSLSLSNNSIKRLEKETWSSVQQLVSLDLSSNNLSEISQHNFEGLSKLKKLHLQRNQITYIDDGSFGAIGNLEYLDLSGNRLPRTIEGTSGPFSVLRKLQTLELKDNDVKSINKKAFLGLESLLTLNLDGNNITTIEFNAFEPLKSLEMLAMNSTHFLCDCKLQWLFGWLSSSRSRLQQSGRLAIVCDYPETVRGKELTALKDDEDFMCNESPKPRLIKEPPNKLVIKGTNVTLECSAISSVAEEMSFQWRRDNFDFRSNETESKTHTLNNNTIRTSFLHLSNVNQGHSGKYQCVVVNSFGSAYSKRFKITVASYPAFRKFPSNVTLHTGTTARLDCSAYGEPLPQIAWQKDGGNDFPAARERRMHVMTSDDAFFIVNAKPSDMGVYTCTAENSAGIIKANATLTVYEKPSFIKPTDSLKDVTTGKSCVLECMARGSPKPRLRWYKDDQLLKLSERHFFAADNQLLIITETLSSDIGVYRCEIENDLGAASTYQTLKVSKSIGKAIMNTDEMTGIIIITVFCCTVGTSVIWVVIIYHTKKGNETNTASIYSGAGNNDLGNVNGLTPTINLPSGFLIQQQSGGMLGTFCHVTNGGDGVGSGGRTLKNYDENNCMSLSKDSGTSDSAKRSRSADDLTLNLNDSSSSNCSNVGFELTGYNHRGRTPAVPPSSQQQQQQQKPSSPSSNKFLNNEIIPTSLSMQHVLHHGINNNQKVQISGRNTIPYTAEQSLPLIVRNHSGTGNSGNGIRGGYDSNSIPSSNCSSSSCAMIETSMSV